MRLEIVLKSDLCVASGENFNSYIDTDVVFDDYGLPYIPAKRLKGVIRESALELVEFGLFTKEDYEKVFGIEGNSRAVFSIDNAFLNHAEDYTRDLMKCSDATITHPQKVLELFTYTRTQTALEAGGTIKENSLRTFRVVNRGLQFNSNITMLENISSNQKELLVQAAKMVKHIGSSRTRGLGLVDIKVREDLNETAQKDYKFILNDKNCIQYKIHLNGPILCKTSNGCQEKTDDFIQGSKIIGIFAELMDKDCFAKLMGYENGSIDAPVFSHAYIFDGEERCTPIPLSYQKRKNESFLDGKMMAKNRLSDYMDEEQWTSFRTGWISSSGVLKNIETQINYHHKRPDNKAAMNAELTRQRENIELIIQYFISLRAFAVDRILGAIF